MLKTMTLFLGGEYQGLKMIGVNQWFLCGCWMMRDGFLCPTCVVEHYSGPSIWVSCQMLDCCNPIIWKTLMGDI